MADITMCMGGFCSHKKKCYRYTAHASDMWQSYFTTPPFVNQTCEFFQSNDNKISSKKIEKIQSKIAVK